MPRTSKLEANIFFPPHSGHEKKKLRLDFPRGNFTERTFRKSWGGSAYARVIAMMNLSSRLPLKRDIEEVLVRPEGCTVGFTCLTGKHEIFPQAPGQILSAMALDR